jgi:glycosyltransferase involved in cell wall biosynthesis
VGSEKVSVITTLLNEENTIGPLLDSLFIQTKKPDELIIVDGGSKDNTVLAVEGYRKLHKEIKLIIKKGSIAHGRNVAVENSRYSLIAQIDGGCVADKKWLERLTKPFEDEEVGLVAGFYIMVGDSALQKAIAPYHGVPERKYDPRCFMPSGRSMAFRKEIWKKVGGYSECLERAGEDTLFNYKVLKAGIKIVRVKDALVYWELPHSFNESVKKLFYYAKGDAQAAIWWHPAQRLSSHNIKILSIFARYIFAVILLFAGFSDSVFLYLLFLLFVFYASWSIHKLEDVVTDFDSKLWLPIIQISSDLTIMAGFVTGLLARSPSRL